jgi:hypothetical protein
LVGVDHSYDRALVLDHCGVTFDALSKKPAPFPWDSELVRGRTSVDTLLVLVKPFV